MCPCWQGLFYCQVRSCLVCFPAFDEMMRKWVVCVHADGNHSIVRNKWTLTPKLSMLQLNKHNVKSTSDTLIFTELKLIGTTGVRAPPMLLTALICISICILCHNHLNFVTGSDADCPIHIIYTTIRDNMIVFSPASTDCSKYVNNLVICCTITPSLYLENNSLKLPNALTEL